MFYGILLFQSFVSGWKYTNDLSDVPMRKGRITSKFLSKKFVAKCGFYSHLFRWYHSFPVNRFVWWDTFWVRDRVAEWALGEITGISGTWSRTPSEISTGSHSHKLTHLVSVYYTTARVEVWRWIFLRNAVKCGEKKNFTAYFLHLFAVNAVNRGELFSFTAFSVFL